MRNILFTFLNKAIKPSSRKEIHWLSSNNTKAFRGIYNIIYKLNEITIVRQRTFSRFYFIFKSFVIRTVCYMKKVLHTRSTFCALFTLPTFFSFHFIGITYSYVSALNFKKVYFIYNKFLFMLFQVGCIHWLNA